MATKQDIFREHLASYLKAERRAKGAVLTHVCFITGMHRKAAVRKFRRLQVQDPGKQEARGRPTSYTPDVTLALRTVWEAGNEVCGELLHPVIAEYVAVLRRDGLWEHGDGTTEQLLAMSQATVKRRIAKFRRVRRGSHGVSDTKPSHLKHLVPIFTGPWAGRPPGYGQVDTVRHSGSASGDAVYTFNYTDAATLAFIPRAQLNKGQAATLASMEAVRIQVPFPWLGAHPDTGTEFINHMVVGWCREQGIEYTRSRPNHKNDNMHVEERNGHAVRRTVGYATLDCQESADALNELYDVLTPYLLHFVAVRRQTSRERVGARYVRTYEKTAATPYQRILDHPAVAEGDKDKLRAEHGKLNPLLLKREVDRRVKKLYDTQKTFGSRS